MRPLIPDFLAQLRPIAKLLGTNTHSTVKSSISSQSCPNPASFADAQNSSKTLTPTGHATAGSTIPEQAAAQTATAGTLAGEADSEADSEADNEADNEADIEADSSLVTSVESELPDLSSGNGVPTQTLLPEQGHLSYPQESAPPGFSLADPQHDAHHMGLLSQQRLPAELANLLDATADR